VSTAPRTFISLSFATALGIGYVPVAPGTFGSAAGLLLWLLLPASAAAQGLAIVIMFVAGSLAGNAAERYYG
jgi:phosphatidylglycerophosphatase A